MTRFSVIGAAVLLAASLVSQTSHAQDSWNHGFGPRNYGYSGDAYSQSYATPGYSNGYSNSGALGFGYTNSYVTGFSPYYGVYPYYAYDGVGLGVYPNGIYGYSGGPGYYGYQSYYAPYGNYLPYRGARINPNAGVMRPKQPKKQPHGVKQPAAKKPAQGGARAF